MGRLLCAGMLAILRGHTLTWRYGRFGVMLLPSNRAFPMIPLLPHVNLYVTAIEGGDPSGEKRPMTRKILGANNK
jgi:hypothetical protein